MYILEIRDNSFSENGDKITAKKTYGFESKEDVVKFLNVENLSYADHAVQLHNIRATLLNFLANGKNEKLLFDTIHIISDLLHTTQEKING